MGRINNREAVRRLEHEARRWSDLRLLCDVDTVLGVGLGGAARRECEREDARQRLAAHWPSAANWDKPGGCTVDEWLCLDSGLRWALDPDQAAAQMAFPFHA